MWDVTLEFKKGPAFGSIINAPTKERAIAKVTEIARNSGFNEKVKKAMATEVTTDACTGGSHTPFLRATSAGRISEITCEREMDSTAIEVNDTEKAK